MAEHKEFYSRAYYYNVIFDRDVRAEADFLLAVYEKHNGRPAQSVLDIACGPGYHALQMGKDGLRAAGLDFSHEMIEMARQNSAEQGLQVEWLQEDMRRFTLSAPVDLAFVLFDSIDALLTNNDLTEHLKAVAANLNPGGIYLIDITHPRDTSLYDYGKFSYHGKRGGTSVDLLWATNHPVFDPRTGIAEVEVTMKVKENGRKFTLKDKAFERMLFPQEISLLAEHSGVFKLVDWFGAFNINQPFDNSPKSRRMIAVLQKV